MSLFGRIKSAVMGNPVTREYEIGRHIASAGPGLMWKIHDGIKKSSRQEVSVFVFNKKAPEIDKLPKRQREAIFELLKKGPTHLIKLRHPQVLTVEHQVEESNDTIAFVTEPVFASLANVLGHYDNVPSPLPLSIKEHQLHPVEIQYGLFQLAEALDFLHSDVKMMHGNVTLMGVVINKRGAWKLMGFNFCCYSHYQTEAQTSFVFREWDTKKPIHTNPSLDYLAPEYVLTKSCNQPSDVFSYGMLCYAVYNEGKPLFENHNNMLSFKSNAEQVSRITETALGQVPAEFKSAVRSMLAIEPNVRPDALQITKHVFFEEVVVSTLKYLDMLYQRSDMEKSQFFKKNLARIITKLPKRVVHQLVLPALSGEFRNNKMVPFVLPLVLIVAEDYTLNEYAEHIMPVLRQALHIQDPIQVPLIFLQKMDLLLKMTSQEDIKAHVLPMIISSLETEHGQLQGLCVTILPTFAKLMDYSSMKHSIVPRITALCIQARDISLQVKCLVCLAQMLDILDKHIVLDHVLPILQQIPCREPGVLMAVLGIYHQTLVNKKLGIDKTMLAASVIPFLVPLSIEPTLNLKQFNQFMKVIREMLQAIETEQQAHLEQLSKMEEQTKSTVAFAQEVYETKAMDDAINRLEDMFTGSGSHDTSGPSRRGTTAPSASGTSFTSGSTIETSQAGKDLLGGLTTTNTLPISSPSVFPQTTPPKTTMYTLPSTTSASGTAISFAEAKKPPASQFPSQVEPLQPAKQYSPQVQTRSTGYNSPSIQPQSNLNSMGGTLGTGQTSFGVQQASFGSPSSSILTPTATGQTSSASYTRNSMGSGSTANNNGTLFSGMQMNPQPSAGILSPQGSNAMQGSSSGMFSGMQINTAQTLQPTPAVQQQQGVTQPLVPSQPLVPVQTNTQQQQQQQQPLGGTGASWSSNIQSSSSPLSQMNQGNTFSPQLQATVGQNAGSGVGGWSSNIASGNGNASMNSTGSGWSQNVGGGIRMGQSGGMEMGRQQYGSSSAGMGMGQQQYGMGQSGITSGLGQQYGTGQTGLTGMGQQQTGTTGMGWSSGNGHYSYQQGMGPMGNTQHQPLPAAVAMMGGGQPLTPQGVATQGYRAPQQGMMNTNTNKPAPGANPFADLSFLS